MSEFKIIKEDRKSLAAEVYPDFQVIIKAPKQAKDFEIDDFIKRKTLWIKKQIDYFKQFNAPESKIYESGSSALYLGRQYQIIIERAALKNVVKVLKNKIHILSSSPQKIDEINKAFETWLLGRANVIFQERLKECIKAFPDLEMPTLKVRKLKRRWGSYLKKHEIVLNPDLIKASKQSIDYKDKEIWLEHFGVTIDNNGTEHAAWCKNEKLYIQQKQEKIDTHNLNNTVLIQTNETMFKQGLPI